MSAAPARDGFCLARRSRLPGIDVALFAKALFLALALGFVVHAVAPEQVVQRRHATNRQRNHQDIEEEAAADQDEEQQDAGQRHRAEEDGNKRLRPVRVVLAHERLLHSVASQTWWGRQHGLPPSLSYTSAGSRRI